MKKIYYYLTCIINCFLFSTVYFPLLSQMHTNDKMIDMHTPQLSIKLSKSQQLFTRDIVKLLSFMHKQGYETTLGEAMRSREQALIYALQGIGIANSLHCKRLALDINLFNAQGSYLSHTQDHEPFGIYWESLSTCNKWGGRLTKPDGNHYERTPGCIEK